MPKAPPMISDLFNIPTRFMRSVQLERDFQDPNALDNYIVTPAVADAFRRLASGAQPAATRRAWRITGDYGVGKSAFALVTAHLLATPAASKSAQIAAAMGWNAETEGAARYWAVLVTGAREGLVGALARATAAALRARTPAKRKPSQGLAGLITRAEDLAVSQDPLVFEAFVEDLRSYLTAEKEGLLLIVDEMGKLLEYAAGEVGREDVFLLQRLAEMASRSGDRPMLFVGLLHQGFQAYAERLPARVRHEWDKVAGRFEEIVFDQPLAHTAALVGGALGVATQKLGTRLTDAARKAAAVTATMGWLSGATSSAKTLDAPPLYPLHPTVLPPLVRFFARYGQHERSLFGFLLSSEPFGLQTFAEQAAGPTIWYDLAEFYMYVRAVFGHRLSGHQNHWLRISATIDTSIDLEPLETRVLKAVGVLNLLDADDLLPTDAALRACFSSAEPSLVDKAIRSLVSRGLLFRRGSSGGYRLWPHSSVNLHTAFAAATRAIGPIESVSANIDEFLDREPVLARRHYVKRGTMRFFEVRYAQVGDFEKVAGKPTGADGLIVVGLADTPEGRDELIADATRSGVANRKDVLLGVLQPLGALIGEIRDLKCWQWIAANTPELAHDTYAAAEVTRQISQLTRTLNQNLASLSGLRQRTTDEMAWFHRGAALAMAGGLSRELSNLCDDLFESAPRVSNELLNRNMLSSPAAAARMRLIEGLFDASDRPILGIDAVKAPPEKSMYLSVIQKGELHRPRGDGWEITLPARDADPLNLRPALDEIMRLLVSAGGARVLVSEIFAALKASPFGVRDGLAPLLLALVLKTSGHQIAVYENGTFRAAFSAQDFMRLTKAPGVFELQHYEVEGVRAEVFARLAAIFTTPNGARPAELLDVVQALCRFAAGLPEYTRKAGALSPASAAVRDVLMSAREPAPMLFRELPLACDLAPFIAGEPLAADRVSAFVKALETAVTELRSAYPALLARIAETVAEATGYGGKPFDRIHLASRAARVSLMAQQPKLRTFALRLRDPGTSDDAWAEAVASFVTSKPPNRWNASDEGRCAEELVALGELFGRVEAAAFDKKHIQSDKTAVRVALTRADGMDLSHIVHADPLDPAHATQLASMAELLPRGREMRVQFLMQLLWRELEDPEAAKPVSKIGSSQAESDVG